MLTFHTPYTHTLYNNNNNHIDIGAATTLMSHRRNKLRHLLLPLHLHFTGLVFNKTHGNEIQCIL